MTAVRRMTMKRLSIAAGASVALALAGPALAQNNTAPVDVTAAPPPSPGTIGPSQLRNFSLDGTVTRPADRPAAATTASPQPRATQPAATSPATTPSDAPETAASRQATPAPSSNRVLPPTAPSSGAGDARPATATVTPSPNSIETDSAPPPAFGSDAAASSTTLAKGGGIGWSWIVALLALVGGGAFIAWSRRNRRQRYGDPGRMAFAGLVPEVGPEPAPLPPPRPRPDPVPPRAQPRPPAAPAPKPKPVSDDGLIVSTRLKPEISVRFQPDRAVITDSDVMVQFDVVVTNSGSAPARQVLVEACMVCAHGGQDAEIAAFFQRPAGQGDRIAAIPPLGHISLKSAVRLPLAQLRSFEMEGRTLFVPLVAFNILFSGDSRASASFLVGRGTDEDDKLAPFRLDLGPRIFRGLSSRPHSNGLSRS